MRQTQPAVQTHKVYYPYKIPGSNADFEIQVVDGRVYAQINTKFDTPFRKPWYQVFILRFINKLREIIKPTKKKKVTKYLTVIDSFDQRETKYMLTKNKEGLIILQVYYKDVANNDQYEEFPIISNVEMTSDGKPYSIKDRSEDAVLLLIDFLKNQLPILVANSKQSREFASNPNWAQTIHKINEVDQMQKRVEDDLPF